MKKFARRKLIIFILNLITVYKHFKEYQEVNLDNVEYAFLCKKLFENK